MKATEAFKETIQKMLEEKASSDQLFAETYKKENKSIEECCNFIIQEVRKSGCCGFDDSEILSMAMHYYDEDNIKNIKSTKCEVVVNHSVELTEEDKEKAKRAAVDELKKLEMEKIMAASKKVEEDRKKKLQEKKEKLQQQEQLSLF